MLGGLRGAALRIPVPEVLEALRAHHDNLGAGESEDQVPDVQEHEGGATARQFHGADVEEELTRLWRCLARSPHIFPPGT